MATVENTLSVSTEQQQEQAAQAANNDTLSIPQGDWIKEKATVRSYWKWITKKVRNKKTGIVTEKQVVKFIAKAASEGQANWKEIENKKDKDGNPEWNFFSENSFQRHVVKTMDAFYALVPDQEGPEAFDQQAYVANAGVNYVQNSKMNSLAVEPKEGTGINGIPPEPAHNQEDIDLAPFINEKPGRRVKTVEEKISEMLLKSGMDASAVAMLLASMQAKAAAAAASGTALPAPEGEEEAEEEDEEGEEGEETPA